MTDENRTEVVIVTGLSGAGKSVAMKNMEDIGYYCVDNIPPALISVFYELCEKSSDAKMKKVAIVTDIRLKVPPYMEDDETIWLIHWQIPFFLPKCFTLSCSSACLALFQRSMVPTR